MAAAVTRRRAEKRPGTPSKGTAPSRARKRSRVGRPCTVCRLPEAQLGAVNQALVAGGSDREVAAKVRGISHDAVRRHRESHLPAHLARAAEAAEVANADTLLAQVRALHARALAILTTAEQAGDLRTALGGIREARG